MCIVVVTTAHPDYPLILLNNRDEYLHRPTAPAEWWDEPYDHVLGGRDLHREERGTWLGITKQGRIACLTNFREEGQALVEGRRSRGAIVNAFLKTPPDSPETTEEAAEKLMADGVDGVGGFSLLFGRVQSLNQRSNDDSPALKTGGKKGLAIVSNRSTDLQSVVWLCSQPGETHALSNSHFGDKSWAKVVSAEESVAATVKLSSAAHEPPDKLIKRLLAVLSVDNLPRQRGGEGWEVYLRQLRNSVFIPAIGDRSLRERKEADEIAAAHGTPNGITNIDVTSGVYGTQKQTVILVNKEGKATFFERTLFDGLGCPVAEGESDRKYDFQIEGW